MVFTFEGIPFPLIVGRELSICNNLKEHLKSNHSQKIDCLSLPLFHPKFTRDKSSIEKEIDPLAKPDTLIDSENWIRNVIGMLSRNINLDSPYLHINSKSKFYLKQELNYAIHLGVGAFILPKVSNESENYSRVINKFLLRGTGNTQIWIRAPLTEEGDQSWELFNSFRLRLANTSALGICLEIRSDLPEKITIKRWLAENIKAVILPTNIFLSDDSGRPTLSKKHETLIQELFWFRPVIIIKPQTNTEDISKYRDYLVQLFIAQPQIHEIEYIQYSFNDVLQQPLQPLRDNLESQLYAHFEKDDVKYQYYEKAIYLALKENLIDQERIVIMVIGAGRAPLVKACFKAALELNRNIFVYAIEKNPNAIVTINSFFASNRSNLKDKMAVVCKDIRYWEPPEKADILFSELLGSFADNELSPEILDWSQRLLKPGGLNIPYEYSSFLSPISYPTIHNKLSNKGEKSFEIPHVVKLKRYYAPCEVKKCFTFNHPRTKDQKDNKRFTSLKFEFTERTLIHGFAGYFEGKLYGDVCISINPESLTPHLYSWFPIFFPLENPMLLDKDLLLRINVWRLASGKKVWYEWQSETINRVSNTIIQSSKIHNANGQSYNISL